MGEIRDLINECKRVLDEDKTSIFKQIADFVEGARTSDSVTHYLFHIDDRSWFTIYFHHCEKTEELSDDDLKTPKFLETAVNEAGKISEDDDGDDENTFFAEVNDEVMNIISDAWKKAGGLKLKAPCYITFHDADYYYDIAQDKVFGEDDLEGILS
ncbi:MAG: hypothetical protein HC846_13570 [Blastocatellia bacterium]|nr:hypothetical protein [Blastocatellia bacterium]